MPLWNGQIGNAMVEKVAAGEVEVGKKVSRKVK